MTCSGSVYVREHEVRCSQSGNSYEFVLHDEKCRGPLRPVFRLALSVNLAPPDLSGLCVFGADITLSRYFCATITTRPLWCRPTFAPMRQYCRNAAPPFGFTSSHADPRISDIICHFHDCAHLCSSSFCDVTLTRTLYQTLSYLETGASNTRSAVACIVVGWLYFWLVCVSAHAASLMQVFQDTAIGKQVEVTWKRPKCSHIG